MNINLCVTIDEATLLHQGKIRLELMTKSRRNLKIHIVVMLTLLVLVPFTIDVVPIIVLVASISFVVLLYRIMRLLKANKLIKQAVTQTLAQLSETDRRIEYELNDDHFRFKDSKREAKMTWDSFTSYSMKGDSILLNQSDNFESSFVLTENQLRKENFEILTGFLVNNSKLKPKQI